MTKNLLLSRLPALLYTVLLAMVLGCVTDDLEEPIESEDVATNSEKFTKRSSNFNFTASLKGDNEVPPKTTNATGNAIVKISKDETSIYYKITVGNIEDVRASHFHMALPGENGPVVVTLFTNTDQPAGRTNGILAEGTITAKDVGGPLSGDLAAVIEEIRNGGIYVNVHTAEIPSGELRGNL